MIMPLNNRLFLVLLFSTLPFFAQAKEKVAISSYYIPGLVDSAEQGIMIDMLDKIEQAVNLEFEVNLMPTKRVQLGFSHGVIDGYFPELEQHRDPKSCRTVPFMKKGIIAVTRYDDMLITNIEQLYGRTIGAVAGYSYGQEISENKQLTIVHADNDKTNLKKLLAGRIDVILGDYHSTLNAINEYNAKTLVRYDLQQPINLLDVFFVFKPDATGMRKCDLISKGIEVLRKNGDLHHWFGYR